MRKIVLACCLVVLTTLIGCKKAIDKTVTEVEIGALLSLTGNWSTLGLTSQKAIGLAVDDVNAYMEQKGTNIRFTGMVFDTKLDTTIAKLAMTDIVRTRTKYVIGPQSSAELAAVKPLADQNNILVVSQGSTASSLAISGDGIFRFCPTQSSA